MNDYLFRNDRIYRMGLGQIKRGEGVRDFISILHCFSHYFCYEIMLTKSHYSCYLYNYHTGIDQI